MTSLTFRRGIVGFREIAARDISLLRSFDLFWHRAFSENTLVFIHIAIRVAKVRCRTASRSPRASIPKVSKCAAVKIH